jgi:hypothetical protein
MGWNYVATFTGTWSIADFPAGAVDESGTLWVMYGDKGNSDRLTYFSHSLPQNGTSFRVYPNPLKTCSWGSPYLVPVHGKLVTLWTDWGSSYNLWGVLDPENQSLSQKALVNYSRAGSVAAYFPQIDTLFTTGQGYGDAHREENLDLVYNDVTGLDTPEPHTGGIYELQSSLGQNQPCHKSYYPPGVAAMPNGEVAVLFKGIGRPGAANSDDKLYFISATNPLKPEFSDARSVQYPGPGETSATAVSMTRPNLALHGTGSAATLVAMYPGTASGQLSYLVGTLNGDGVTWAAPPPDGIVPLDAVLAHAGAGEGPVTLTNPVAVWVTAPESSDTLYLLVGDQVDGTIEGPLYVVRYMGEQ